MQTSYKVTITDPHTHLVNVDINIKDISEKNLDISMPVWSPGSYLVRDYSRNVQAVKATQAKTSEIQFKQTKKNRWTLELTDEQVSASKENPLTFSYQVYCYEVSVRTSYIDNTRAFLHGPSYLMTVEGTENQEQTIQFVFPPLWSKIHLGLKEISEKREEFIYTAENFDVLIDAPVEIGCHDSDGFMAFGKEHYVCFTGETYSHPYDLKKDMKTIVETVGKHFEDIPYDDYTFLTFFAPNTYGGLEHLNSTALQFDGRMLSDRMSYLNWLSLVAHEYFHTWNVKRIRPRELGPFNYNEENYTRMHWLTEGLTSFMDELFVLRAGLCTLEEYLEMQKKNLNRYLQVPGRRFHSLEDSSYNAWIKLYKSDENTNNSSVSYYLKGGIVFQALHLKLRQEGKSINELLTKLWSHYKENPAEGLTREGFFDILSSIASKELVDQFDTWISTTEDIDLEKNFKESGIEFEWQDSQAVSLGCDLASKEGNVVVTGVPIDSEAYKAGLHARDEILAINGQRFSATDLPNFTKLFQKSDKRITLLISRLGVIHTLEASLDQAPRLLKNLKVTDESKAREALLK